MWARETARRVSGARMHVASSREQWSVVSSVEFHVVRERVSASVHAAGTQGASEWPAEGRHEHCARMS